MIWLCFFWFSLLYGCTFFASPSKDVFSPLRFISIKFAVFNLPFIFFTALYPDSFLKGILTVCHTDVYSAFYNYTLLQTLAYISLVCGILVFKPKTGIAEHNSFSFNPRRVLWITACLFAVAMSGYAFFLFRIGGLGYLLTHLKDRVSLQGGQYSLILLELFPLVLLLILLLSRYYGKVAKKYFFLLLCLFFLVYTSFGGRKPAMIVAFAGLGGWHYYVEKIRVNKSTVLAGIIACVLLVSYIIAIPILRGGNQKLIATDKNPGYTVSKNFLYNFSYVFIDVFAANYFNDSNAWHMEGYFAPAGAFMHKGDKGGIPQVDQGVYFKSIYLQQKDFRPPMPRRSVSKTSWPTENFGFAYANFLWIGIVVFFFLQGLVFSGVYRLFQKQYFNPVTLLFYLQVLVQFNFSSLRIAFFLKTLPLYCLCWFVFNKFALHKNQK